MRPDHNVKSSRRTGVPQKNSVGSVVILLILQGSKKRKCYQDDNRVVIKWTNYQSGPKRNGYQKRMHKCWVEKGMLIATEQRLQDQKNNILKKNWLTSLELKKIRRNVTELEHGNILEEVEVDERETCNIESPGRFDENWKIEKND